MQRPEQDICLTMAEYQFKCRNEKLMWQWLFEWATWEDDMQCHVDRIVEQRKPVMTEEQMKRFNETFPEFNSVLGRTAVAWVEVEVMEKLAEKFDEIFEEDK